MTVIHSAALYVYVILMELGIQWAKLFIKTDKNGK